MYLHYSIFCDYPEVLICPCKSLFFSFPAAIFIGFERSEYRVDEAETVFTGEDSPILIIKENGVVSEQTFRVLITAGPADLQGVANAEHQLDYSVTAGVLQTVVFEVLPEEQSFRFPFAIFGDELPEGEEAFGLTLATTTGEGGQFSVGTNGSTVVIIEDDDRKFIQMSINLEYSSACEMRFAILFDHSSGAETEDRQGMSYIVGLFFWFIIILHKSMDTEIAVLLTCKYPTITTTNRQ